MRNLYSVNHAACSLSLWSLRSSRKRCETHYDQLLSRSAIWSSALSIVQITLLKGLWILYLSIYGDFAFDTFVILSDNIQDLPFNGDFI